MPEIIIRKATVPDVEKLARLCRSSFYDTYAAANTKEDMDLFLKQHFSEERILEEVGDPRGTNWLAFVNEELSGYARVSSHKKPEALGLGSAVEVERIYVAKEWQGHRIGARLMGHCIGEAKKAGVHILWLGVWEHNIKAIHFYEKLGLTKFGEHGFLLGKDLQTDYLMKLDLNPGPA